MTTMDIVPTIADIAGAKLPEDRPIDGVSLLPHLENEQENRPQLARFWFSSNIEGQLVYSSKIMQRMLKAQQNSEPWESPYSPITSKVIKESLSRLRHGRAIGNAALIDGNWKFYQRGQDQFELYNLASDPGETNNIVSSYQERGEEMKQELASWKESVKKSMVETLSRV